LTVQADVSISSSGPRNAPLGALRTFLTLLVVAHHALLAYHSFAPALPESLVAQPRMWMAFPIADSQRSAAAPLLVGFNDTFFMSLLFLVSGVFAWPSLNRKGAGTFLRDRLLKLGLPFLVSAAVFAPLAYYPTFLSIRPQAVPFWRQWLSLGEWPAGPAWFLWVLLAFGALASLLYAFAPGWGNALGRGVERFAERPLRLFLLLVLVSALAYLPLAAAFNPMYWANAGPFYVQASRFLHYAVYFFAGAALGAFGLDRGPLAREGELARRWPLWVGASLGAFILATVTFLVVISTLEKGGPGALLGTFGNFTFVLSCAATSFACLAVFIRFAQKTSAVSQSLGENAYGIYLFHYFCVSWLQLALLPAPLSGAAKGVLVFAGAVLLSWGLSAGLRRIPMLRKVI
jgi:peptidoglycan/LPS O-acetylase OafA/YrhL